MTVSSASILCMAVSALLSIGVPIGLLIYFRKKYKAKIVPALVGAAAFVVFALGLEQVLHLLVLRPAADGTTTLSGKPFLYMLYGCFAAGIFEETARYVSLLLLRRKYGGIGTALSYGVGHGGIEAVLIGGVMMLINLVAAIAVNSGVDWAMTAQFQSLSQTPPYLFLVSGVERMLALAIQISLSVVVFYSVYAPRKYWLYPLAILLHAVVDAPAALMQAGVLHSVLLVEGVILAFTAMLVALAIYVHRKLKPAEEAPDFILDGGAGNEKA